MCLNSIIEESEAISNEQYLGRWLFDPNLRPQKPVVFRQWVFGATPAHTDAEQ